VLSAQTFWLRRHGKSAGSVRVLKPVASQPESAFREVIASYGLITRLMHAHFAHFGISGPKWGVLRALHRAEAEGVLGLRMVDLGERLLVRPPSVTTLAGRLERDGLVALHASESDKRARLVSLTRRGRDLVERVLRVHGARVREVMSGLDGAEQCELHRLMLKLNAGIRGMIGGSESQVAGAAKRAPARRAV
jgi:DNA-binding MarR family transcriptional regulator